MLMVKTYSAREIIRMAYGSSRNFMTPHVISYGKINRKMAFELSKGTGINHETIYGVSIAKVVKGGKAERQTSLSGCFHSLSDARRHIRFLKQKYVR